MELATVIVNLLTLVAVIVLFFRIRMMESDKRSEDVEYIDMRVFRNNGKTYGLHKVTVTGRQIFLDDNMLYGVQEYELKNSANEKLAELTLKMNVFISEEKVVLNTQKNIEQ